MICEEKICYIPKNSTRYKGIAFGSHRWADGGSCEMFRHNDGMPGT
ncbi:hypothetical protein HMPREF1870_02239 [Bacteroidales bacterium KA00344]|nr:hypothetical protein HMPREF1870_02239 [Bacteroidales bacterium KA00344]